MIFHIFNCLYLAILIVAAVLTRATARRIAGAVAGGLAYGVVAPGIIALGRKAGLWRMALTWTPYLRSLMLINFALSAYVYLVTWRIDRRFGWRGLAVVVLILAVIGPPRDYAFMAKFPEWGAFAPGVAPVLAVAANYVLLVLVGHGVMRLAAGPSGADHLARRPLEVVLTSRRNGSGSTQADHRFAFHCFSRVIDGRMSPRGPRVDPPKLSAQVGDSLVTQDAVDRVAGRPQRAGPVMQKSGSGGRRATEGKRIVLTTLGSLGDLHPYIALALELRARGHEPILATSEAYRHKVEPLGIGFQPIRPDEPDWTADPGLMARLMDARKGGEAVIREYVMPNLRQTFEDTVNAIKGADLVVSHVITFTTRLAAETRGVPWVSSMLQPFGFFSAHDPPVLAPGPYLAWFRPLGPAFHRLIFGLARRVSRPWSEPWHQLRAEIGLPPAPDPLFEGQHAPSLVLALFSRSLAEKQLDWPPQTIVTGFPFYDRGDEPGLPAGLGEFLDAGHPPIVFTLGSSAVRDAGRFYEEGAAAAKALGRRAVLLIGKDARNRLRNLPDGVAAFEYAPYSELFPRASAIVHQGGVGTTAQAMRAGKPMLIMPYSHDQPDHAARMKRLGIGRSISRARFTAPRAAAELKRLLDDPVYARRASEVGERVRSEDGVGTACDALEAVLAGAEAARAETTVH
jgi:rhamnosyltransferase subunit B